MSKKTTSNNKDITIKDSDEPSKNPIEPSKNSIDSSKNPALISKNGFRCLTKCHPPKEKYIHPLNFQILHSLHVPTCGIYPIKDKNWSRCGC